MRIDAHQHFWLIERGDYGWLKPELGPIYRDFMPVDLVPLLAEAGVERTILVQAAPTEAETAFLLDLARRTSVVAGVVGWADFAAPGVGRTIGALAREPLLVGLRPMVQDIADDDWLRCDDLAEAFTAMTAHGLVFDALVLPRHLSRRLVVLDRHPGLRVVVDHAAKPDIARQRFDPWRADMAAIAARPNTWCKLSGLVTEAGAAWSLDDLRPVVDHVLRLFGPGRLLWGSDWPVATRVASYRSWFAAAVALTSHVDPDGVAAIFGGTAAELYLSRRGRR